MYYWKNKLEIDAYDLERLWNNNTRINKKWGNLVVYYHEISPVLKQVTTNLI